MKTTAAVLVESGRPLEVAELDFPRLKAGQAVVEIAYSGVCRTQLMEARGERGPDPWLPHCLGHEGSGTVWDAGPRVRKVKPGDRVILSWIKGGGLDGGGTVYRWGGREVNAGGVTTFMRHAVVSENRLTALPEGFPMREAALLGCAVATGFGAVFNTLAVGAGESVAVFGAGGIGLCAVAAARAAGARPLIAVDLRPERLGLARRFGATHAVDAGAGDPVAAIAALCPGGVDGAIEATGRTAVMAQALASVRARGGRAVIAGNAAYGEALSFDPGELNLGKRLLGTWGGDSDPDRDYPRYCRLIGDGEVKVAALIAGSYALEDADRALGDLEAGRAVRPLIDMTLARTS